MHAGDSSWRARQQKRGMRGASVGASTAAAIIGSLFARWSGPAESLQPTVKERAPATPGLPLAAPSLRSPTMSVGRETEKDTLAPACKGSAADAATAPSGGTVQLQQLLPLLPKRKRGPKPDGMPRVPTMEALTVGACARSGQDLWESRLASHLRAAQAHPGWSSACRAAPACFPSTACRVRLPQQRQASAACCTRPRGR